MDVRWEAFCHHGTIVEIVVYILIRIFKDYRRNGTPHSMICITTAVGDITYIGTDRKNNYTQFIPTPTDFQIPGQRLADYMPETLG